MEHRREIDGLRAIAVIPVILFHAGFATFSGGFVGVDVFFVISGFLITTIILAEKQAGTFSLMAFYERRARRILPALFVVMLVCLPFAWAWLMPRDMKGFSQSLVAVSGFASNILFWKTSNYFDSSTELAPLLHTWSLAVEEQYYLFFPVFLILAWRFGRRWMVSLLAVLALMSLMLAEWGSVADPASTFYLLPTRGWELLIGAFVAFYFASRQQSAMNPSVQQAGSLAGLLLIVYAVLAFDHHTPFPSLYTLVPTLGTALIILFATPGNWVGRLLSAKWLVGIGLISYSAYLWHQPLFAFARHRSFEEPGRLLFGILMLTTLLLAALSWKYVEAPFRSRQRFSRQQVFGLGAAGSALFVAIGLAGHLSQGFEHRFDREVARIGAPASGGDPQCLGANTPSGCLLGDLSSVASIAVVGDSHSYVLQKQLSAALSAMNKSARLFSDNWCPPLIDVGTAHPSKNPGCRSFITGIHEGLAADTAISDVILVAEWANYTKGYRWNDAGMAHYSDAASTELSAAENVRVFSRGFERTVQALTAAGKNVVVVKSVPEYEADLPKYLSKLMAFRKTVDLGDKAIDQAAYLERNREVEAVFHRKRWADRVSFVDPAQIFCRTGTCRYMDDAHHIFYVDGNHLSDRGARLLVDQIVKQVGRLSSTPLIAPLVDPGRASQPVADSSRASTSS